MLKQLYLFLLLVVAQLFLFKASVYATTSNLVFTGEPDETVVVKSLVFTGNTVFTSAELGVLLAPSLNQAQTLDSMTAFADQVTQKYHQAGYPKAITWIPEQVSTNGEVVVALNENLYRKPIARPVPAPAPSFSPNFIASFLATLKSWWMDALGKRPFIY